MGYYLRRTKDLDEDLKKLFTLPIPQILNLMKICWINSEKTGLKLNSFEKR